MREPRRATALLGTLALAALAGSAVVAPASSAAAAPVTDPAGLVNTFIGTLDEGNTFPGASAPFGMTQVSPTGDHFAGWQYDETAIRGFGHSYVSGAGCWEQGGLLSALPTTGTIGPGGDFDTAVPADFDHRQYAATLDHEGEVGEAGYYRTALSSYGGIDVETTATTRVGVQRYTFAAGDSGNVLLNTGQANETLKVPSSRIRVLDDRTVATEIEVQGFCTGQDFTYTSWFVSTFDRPFDSYGTWNAAGGQPGVAAQDAGPGLKGGWFSFDTTEDRDVQVSTAMSYTGPEGALANLEAEGLAADGTPLPFDAVRDATRAAWNDELSTALVHGGTPDDQVSFYTSLYHAFLQPNTATDVDGAYRGFDDRIHVADGWTYYQFLSLWDTYRTQNQLLAMLQPERAADVGRSVLTIEQQGGWLPRWAYANYEGNVMTGDPVTPFLADLWRYGALPGGVTLDGADTLSGEPVELDAETAFAALQRNVDEQPPADSQFAGRTGLDTYTELGWIAQDSDAPKKGMDDDRRHGGSATMEYAVGDCSVAAMARGLGYDEIADRLSARSANWKNVWDPAFADEERGITGFPRSRDAAGVWSAETPVDAQEGFHEGTPWQYQWLAWHDVPGLIETVGGDEAVIERLDAFFDIDAVRADPAAAARESWVVGTLEYDNQFRYNPNNEPNLHAPWMYALMGEPASTSAVVRAGQSLFTNAPDGVTGNDDLGTMSAWYVFSALGMYPGVSGSGDLLLNAPRFEQVDLTLGDQELTLRAPGADGASLQYIDGVTVDGEAVTGASLGIDDLRAAGEVEFALTADAETAWGTAPEDRPASACSSVAAVDPAPTVAIEADSAWSADPVEVTVTAADAEAPAPDDEVEAAAIASIEWRLDGGEWTVYDGPFTIEAEGEHLVEARATDDAGSASEIAQATVRLDRTAPVTSATQTRDGEAAVVTFAVDEPLSGVASTEYRIDGGPWQLAAGAVRVEDALGAERIEFRSTDVAGNVEEAVSAALLAPGAGDGGAGDGGAGGPGDGDAGPGSGASDPAGSGLATTGAEPLGWAALAALLLAAGVALHALRIRRHRA